MKTRKPLSELQKANLLTGQLLRRCMCTSELIKFLREQGQSIAANEVQVYLNIARAMAYSKGQTAIANAKLAKLKKEFEDDCPF